MKLFQNSAINASYRQRLNGLICGISDFDELRRVFLDDRYGAPHFLEPVLDNEPSAFFTNGNDETLQQAWAATQGLKSKTLTEILLAQIEDHKTEVFYNLDPQRYDGNFAKRLPGHVKRKIAWRAAPGIVDFRGYDLIVSNFPTILKNYEIEGYRTALFFPAHDPILDQYASNVNRDIDVLFCGGYSRHHLRRSELLQSIASLAKNLKVVMHLDQSRFTRLAETPLGLFPPLRKHRRPSAVRKVSQPPVFGRAMYQQISRAKIVVNMAIDMAGADRGNMRCFETLGGRSLLVSDNGNYPPGMQNGNTLLLFNSISDAKEQIVSSLRSGDWINIADKGYDMVRRTYSKSNQFRLFKELI